MITQREMDLAASIQKVTEEVVLRMARHTKEITGAKYLCLAGGVALNCALNGAIAESQLFDRIFVQPAAGDEGASLGAAYHAFAQTSGPSQRPPDPWTHVYWGPEYDAATILA